MYKFRINTIVTLLGISLWMGIGSCKNYLDLKPDKAMDIPNTLADCQLLLDDFATMNTGYPADAEAASDNYYMTDANWNSLPTIESRENYSWAAQAQHPVTQWSNPYKVIFNANQVLKILEKISPAEDEGNYNAVKGAALFFRAYGFYHVAQLFAPPYESNNTTSLGIPLRLSADIDYKSERATVLQTYQQIINDLETAAMLLPLTTTVKSRPGKTAAHAMLARTYLSMEDYPKAGINADLCLKAQPTLIDYNTLNAGTSTSNTPPFSRFNAEVIFHSTFVSQFSLNQGVSKIDNELYNSYAQNDRRKVIFFKSNTGISAGTYAFKGSYDGTTSILFNGLATDEIYLIRAECYARAGNKEAALGDLNLLMKNRWNPAATNPATPFTDITAADPEDALKKILAERRKELVFRGLRWTDLRRLNKDPRFAVTLRRNMNTFNYSELKPNDLRYTLLIPQDVISTAGIAQNPR